MTTSDPLFDESDLDVPEYYCRHGVFIGNPYGADYMCPHCELGTSDEEYELSLARSALRSQLWEVVTIWFETVPSGVPPTLLNYGIACATPIVRMA